MVDDGSNALQKGGGGADSVPAPERPCPQKTEGDLFYIGWMWVIWTHFLALQRIHRLSGRADPRGSLDPTLINSVEVST